MIENRARAAIHRGLPPKPGPGWGTRYSISGGADPQYVVSILYIVVLYTTLHDILGLYRLDTTSCTVGQQVTTIYWAPLYPVEAPIFGTIYSGVGHCRPLLPIKTTSRSQTSIDHYILCSGSTTYSCTLYLVSYSIFLLLFILYLVVLRIFRPSPLRAYCILCTRMSILLHLVETLYLVSMSTITTISCQQPYLAPSAFGAHSMHNCRPATAQHTTWLTACNPCRPTRLRFSHSFRSTYTTTLADPEKRHLAHFGISCIQTRTSTTISCTSPPGITSVQLAQHTILW